MSVVKVLDKGPVRQLEKTLLKRFYGFVATDIYDSFNAVIHFIEYVVVMSPSVNEVSSKDSSSASVKISIYFSNFEYANVRLIYSSCDVTATVEEYLHSSENS